MMETAFPVKFWLKKKIEFEKKYYKKYMCLKSNGSRKQKAKDTMDGWFFNNMSLSSVSLISAEQLVIYTEFYVNYPL